LAASETWTTPKDWSAGEVLTSANFNAQVRDNPHYLKGVVSGSDLQDVVVHANRALKHGAQQVMRGASTTKQHVEAGNESFSMSDMTSTSRSVSFAKAFSAAPNIALGRRNSGVPGNSYTTSESTTGFTLYVNTGGYGAYTGIIPWVALGAD
jgi:hypothetical protein